MPRPASPSLRLSFGAQVAIGAVLGVLLGLAARTVPDAAWLAPVLKTVGDLFVQLLKALVPPLVVTAVIASIANLGQVQNGARLAGRTLLWFAITAACSVTIGLAVGTILQPGLHVGGPLAAGRPDSMGSWTDFLKGIFPSNIFGLQASTTLADGAAKTGLSFNILQLVVISVALGFAAVKLGEKGRPFLALAESLLQISRQLLNWVLKLTPLGTAGLLGTAVASYGWTTLASLGSFAAAVYLGLLLVGFGLYPAILLLKGLPLARFARAALPVAQLGFISRSSIGTLPLTEERTVSALGVPRSYAAFAVPLGATTKMDGCAAIYPAIAALFVAQFYGIALGPFHYAMIAFVSIVGSAATAGVTGATVMLTLTLSTLGLPLEGAGLLLAIDPILDMGRTALNVTGQMLVPYLVAHEEGLLEPEPTARPRLVAA